MNPLKETFNRLRLMTHRRNQEEIKKIYKIRRQIILPGTGPLEMEIA